MTHACDWRCFSAFLSFFWGGDFFSFLSLSNTERTPSPYNQPTWTCLSNKLFPQSQAQTPVPRLRFFVSDDVLHLCFKQRSSKVNFKEHISTWCYIVHYYFARTWQLNVPLPQSSPHFIIAITITEW